MLQAKIYRASTTIVEFDSLQGFFNMQGLDLRNMEKENRFKPYEMPII
jgi:hypothetical protein